MHRFRPRLRHPASVLLLVALLLVPVALSGHTHVGQSTHPCSICALTHHAPILGSVAPPDLGHALVVVLAAAGAALAPVRTDVAVHAGRGPPLTLLTVVA
jgi:hypothetical protein